MLPVLTDEELMSAPLVKRVTEAWPNATEAQRFKMCRLLAYVAQSTYPNCGKRTVRGHSIRKWLSNLADTGEIHGT
jgi:hypothetical protein